MVASWSREQALTLTGVANHHGYGLLIPEGLNSRFFYLLYRDGGTFYWYCKCLSSFIEEQCLTASRSLELITSSNGDCVTSILFRISRTKIWAVGIRVPVVSWCVVVVLQCSEDPQSDVTYLGLFLVVPWYVACQDNLHRLAQSL